MRKPSPLAAAIPALLMAGSLATAVQAAPPTLILHHANIWTVDPAQPQAAALANAGDRIVKVGSERAVMAQKGPKTQIVDLGGAFVLPGLIDAHTHFGNALESFFQVRLVDVNAEPVLLARLRTAAAEVPKGMWITGSDWSSAAAVAARRKGETAFKPFMPSLAAIDAVTSDHPVLLRRYD